MSTDKNPGLLDRLEDLHRHIAQGRIEEAMHTYYADDVTMQDNTAPPCKGLEANLQRERRWLDDVAEWRKFEVKSLAATGDHTFAETSMDFRTKDGRNVHLEQVSSAVWKDGKIVQEHFYHG